MVDLKDFGTWKGDLNEPRHVAIVTQLGVLLNFEIRFLRFEYRVQIFNQLSISTILTINKLWLPAFKG